MKREWRTGPFDCLHSTSLPDSISAHSSRIEMFVLLDAVPRVLITLTTVLVPILFVADSFGNGLERFITIFAGCWSTVSTSRIEGRKAYIPT